MYVPGHIVHVGCGSVGFTCASAGAFARARARAAELHAVAFIFTSWPNEKHSSQPVEALCRMKRQRLTVKQRDPSRPRPGRTLCRWHAAHPLECELLQPLAFVG